ncbi:N-acetyl sugar amidotransferase [Methylobacterium sp. PvR107]|uniref:N-acetyl sugar amidotransferase n=1 Tax=Methylobacterium sp. PvR107 TaxID=2806597 RepID=UPI001FD7DE25|nr:N-acetyl sugar amidotransferase [Methylobacterium sp. PvR107]
MSNVFNYDLPPARWCSRCVNPSRAAVTATFDESGVCSGCRVHEQKKTIDWDERLEELLEIVEPYRKPSGYECVIGVSGGKDSYYQAHFVIEKLGLRPLLVTYNGNNYLDVGWRNLMTMKERFKADHIIVSPSVEVLVRMNRLCFRKMGDMNWQNHAGIATIPMKVAVQHSIPLVFWGEHGWTDIGGMHSLHDRVEYTARYRRDQLLRGYDWFDMLGDEEDPVEEAELEWCKYPADEEVRSLGLRGIFIGNFDPWDANAHARLVTERYGWEASPVPFDRTYRRMSNLDDRYENGAHDYLKYVKFGYGRGTDHACKDIRAGLMTREEGIEMVRRYDHVVPSDLEYWLRYADYDRERFEKIADSFRDASVWRRDAAGEWRKRNIWD